MKKLIKGPLSKIASLKNFKRNPFQKERHSKTEFPTQRDSTHQDWAPKLMEFPTLTLSTKIPHYQTLFPNETAARLRFPPKRGCNQRPGELIKAEFRKIASLKKQSSQLLERFIPPILGAETNGISYARPHRKNPSGMYLDIAYEIPLGWGSSHISNPYFLTKPPSGYISPLNADAISVRGN